MGNYSSIGIDLGGTKTRTTLFDHKFRVLETVKFKTEPGRGISRFERRLNEALKTLLRKAKSGELAVPVLGIGCAGRIDSKAMQVRDSLNVPFLKEYPMGAKLAKLTGAQVFIGNDVHMGLYGEHQLGAAIGLQHVIGVFLGTGIGGALIMNGKLFLGAGGYAGDIGHYLVQPLGPLGGSERQGVLDDFASRTAIAAAAAAFAAKQWAPELLKMAGTDLANIRTSVLAQSIKKGDKQIEELVRSRARIIGIVLSNMVDFINPEMVVIGGGLVEEMPGLILKEVEAGIREHSTAAALENQKVATVKLGDQAVTAGAAKMAWDLFVKNETSGQPPSKAVLKIK